MASFTASNIGGSFNSTAAWNGGVVPPIGSDIVIPSTCVNGITFNIMRSLGAISGTASKAIFNAIVNCDSVTFVKDPEVGTLFQVSGSSQVACAGDFRLNGALITAGNGPAVIGSGGQPAGTVST